MTSARIIEGLARKLGVARPALKQWRRRGVPKAWWFDLTERARAEGVELTREMLEAYPGEAGTSRQVEAA